MASFVSRSHCLLAQQTPRLVTTGIDTVLLSVDRSSRTSFLRFEALSTPRPLGRRRPTGCPFPTLPVLPLDIRRVVPASLFFTNTSVGSIVLPPPPDPS